MVSFLVSRTLTIYQNVVLLSLSLVKCYSEKTNQMNCNKICFSCDCHPFPCEEKKPVLDVRKNYQGLFNSEDKIIDIAKNKAEYGTIRSSKVLWSDRDSVPWFGKDVTKPVTMNVSLSTVSNHSATTFHPETYPSTTRTKPPHSIVPTTSVPPFSSATTETFAPSTLATQLHSTLPTTSIPPHSITTSKSTSGGTHSIETTLTKTVPSTTIPQSSTKTTDTGLKKFTKRTTISTTSAFQTHPTYTEHRQVSVVGSCCETEWETIVPSEVKFKNKVYKVTHFEDSHQILFRGKCANENSVCQNKGTCRTDDSQITFVLIDDPDAAESVRFIPIKHSRSCICVVTGS